LVSKENDMLSRFRKILITLCIIVVIGVIGIILFFSIIFYIDKYAAGFYYNSIGEIPKADAIIVLGAFVYDGRPSPILLERLENALELYYAGKAPKIILSGDHGTKEYDEVNTMKDFMLENGVPREVLFLDHAGFNTYDSMYRAKEIFCVNSLLICTQEFHIGRSTYIARRLGIEAYGYPSNKWVSYYNRQYGFRERLAKIKAFVDIEIVRRKPRFLGEPIPITGSGLETED